MKAIRVAAFGEPEVMQITDVPDLQPDADQVLVRLHAAGINPVDTYIRAGHYAQKPALPYTPGTDGAGVVLADAAGFAAGERVYIRGGAGTYAEMVLCAPAQVYPLPARTTFEEGAALGVPYGTAFRALFGRGGGRAGETVLVHGATGGVGTAAVQLAKAAGLRVFGTGGTAAGLDLIRENGASAVFNHREAGYLDRILAATEGRGVDLILEMLANVNLGNDLTLLAPRGRVVVIGSRGPVVIDPRQAMARDAEIRGMMFGHTEPEELVEIYRAIQAGLEAGRLRPQIAQIFPLAQAPAGHRAVMQSGARGKIILRP